MILKYLNRVNDYTFPIKITHGVCYHGISTKMIKLQKILEAIQQMNADIDSSCT